MLNLKHLICLATTEKIILLFWCFRIKNNSEVYISSCKKYYSIVTSTNDYHRHTPQLVGNLFNRIVVKFSLRKWYSDPDDSPSRRFWTCSRHKQWCTFGTVNTEHSRHDDDNDIDDVHTDVDIEEKTCNSWIVKQQHQEVERATGNLFRVFHNLSNRSWSEEAHRSRSSGLFHNLANFAPKTFYYCNKLSKRFASNRSQETICSGVSNDHFMPSKS